MRVKIFIFLCAVVLTSVVGQVRTDALKQQATLLMKEGRYAEAIDQLNKYISANPRVADGYHFRALSYEKRLDYQYAVLDLRRAIRLDPSNQKIRADLDRVITTWHKILYQKIDGHKRDIAIDPTRAFSYLEIGKSYRWLEEWKDAEIWYDEYLKRDDNASPDEIIRYTEILAKTGSIVKGERILKKYTERYPDDWRIWSRYGYFTYWLGKNKTAEDAFLKSLSYKPFFKEAEDGLDLTRKQGYLTLYQPRAFEKVEYPIDRLYKLLDKNQDDDNSRFELVNELITHNRYEEAYQQLQYLQPKHSEEEKFKSFQKIVMDYRDSTFNKDITTYTESLKNNPTDKEAVLKLANAYGNLFYYDSAIEVLNEYIQDIPEDQDLDARFLYAKFCAWNYESEKAIAQLEKLLQLDPNNLDYQLLRAQIAVWTVNDFDLAEKYLLNIIANRPKDIDAHVSLINLYSWEQRFDEGKKYLDDLKGFAPNSAATADIENTYQLRLMSSEENKILKLRGEAGKLAQDGKCDEAFNIYQDFANKRSNLELGEKIEFASIAVCSKNYQKALELYNEILNDKFDYNIALHRAEIYYILNDTLSASTELEKLASMNPDDEQTRLLLADTYAMNKKPKDAENIYRSLQSSTQDSTLIEKLKDRILLLGTHYAVNKQFDDAFRIFNEYEQEPLYSKYGKDVDEGLLAVSDYLVQEKKFDESEELFDKLDERITDSQQRQTLNMKKMFLADALVGEKEFGWANSIYNDVLDATSDTAQIHMLNDRISWIPPYGFAGGMRSVGSFLSYFLPRNVGISPYSNYYKDNQRLKFWNYGLNFDVGFIGFLSLGGSWSRSNIYNGTYHQDLTQIKGNGSIFFSKLVSVTGGFGRINTIGEPYYNVWNLGFRFQNKEGLNLSLNYENSDARLIFYSPDLLYTHLKVDLFRMTGSYDYNDIVSLSSNYSYYKLSDGNEGNDFQFRLGKRFLPYAFFGYEYYFTDYAFVATKYYSPQDYAAHSIWTTWKYQLDNQIKFSAGGKIGYVPAIDFIVSEVFGEVVYNPLLNLIFTGRVGYSNSYRYISAYRSMSIFVSAYWSFF